MRKFIALRSHPRCAAVVLCLAASFAVGVAEAAESGVFRIPPSAAAGDPDAARTLGVDFERLAAARRAIVAGRPAALVLNLGGGVRYRATVAESAPTLSGGYTLSGALDGVPGGTVTLVVGEGGGALVGTVRTPDAVYSIRPAAAGGWLVEKEPPMPPLREGTPLPPPPAAAPKRDGDSGDDGSEIDVLAAWTPAARRGVGPIALVRHMVELMAAETNAALRASDAATRINLVAAVEVDYEEVEGDEDDYWRTALSDLANLEVVRELRDAYAADLVHLLPWDGADWGTSGRAYMPGAFAVTGLGRVSRLSGMASVFAHETGHNLGLRHDRYEDPDTAPDFDGHGYVNQRAFEDGAPESARWRTVMAYNDQCEDAGFERCRRLFRYSNPRQDHLGDPLGVALGAPSTGPDGPADAARHIGESRRAAANRRASAERCAYRLSPALEAAVPRDGGEFTVRVEAPASCAWTARAHDDWLSLAAAAQGSGRGEVIFRAEAAGDSGWREGGVSVAGEMLAVRQGEPPAFVSACLRSPRIRDILTADGERCEDVNQVDLDSLWELDLENAGIDSLRPGDLAGLRSLEHLDLDGNRLSGPIPPDLWGLPAPGSLDDLRMAENALTGPIPPELGNWSKLRVLSLWDNALSGPIPPEIGNLGKLQVLSLWSNALSGPIPPELGNLGKLRVLSLWDNALSGLIPPELGNLGKLETLYLNYNGLSGSIPPELGRLRELKRLGLSANFLSGPIPPELGRLPELEWLWLRGNNLGGCVPKALFAVDDNDLEHLGLPPCPPALIGLAIESRPSDGRAYGVAERIVTAVRFDQNVAVSGTPRLALRIGGRTRWARFAENRGGGEIVFHYDVAVADRDADGIGIAADALALNGGAIRYPDGPDADLSLGDHAIAAADGHRVRGDRLALADGAATVELSRLFPDGSASYAARASDPGELRLSVADGVLTVAAEAVAVGGPVTVTVTATGPGGETLEASFTVVVEAGPQGFPSGHWWEVLRERLDRAAQ